MRATRAPGFLCCAALSGAALSLGCGEEPALTARGPDSSLRAAFPELSSRVLDEGEQLVATGEGFAPAAQDGPRRHGYAVQLPRNGAEPVRLRMRDGFEVKVREAGLVGPGERAGGAIAYRRAGATSFWTVAARGAEEWLHLEAGVTRGDEPAAVWEVEGATLRQDGERVQVLDGAGVARLHVSAPAAFGASGRAVDVRLGVNGAAIELWVDGAGEVVLVDPEWLATPSMGATRSDHSATLLADGRVLVAGGYGPSDSASTELYDPSTNTWQPAASMSAARSGHKAVRLMSGSVLVVSDTTAERYSPANNTWSSAGTLTVGRNAASTATLLPDGRVLVAGGYVGSAGLTSVEIYNPSTNAWTAAESMLSGRGFHTATLLPNGKVLMAGGKVQFNVSLQSVELYDPATDSWSLAASMNAAHFGHEAVWVPTIGKAMVISSTSSSEMYDPGTNIWTTVAPMSATSYCSPHTATWIQTIHMVLATGGHCTYPDPQPLMGATAAARLYDPSVDTWTATVPMGVGRTAHTATPLPGGEVLIVGGHNSPINPPTPLASAERYSVASGTTCSSAAQCASGFCVDGVCCDSACAWLCMACNVAGQLGACAPIPGGEDPDNECGDEGAASCGQDGACDGAGACRRFAAGTECLPPGCEGDSLVLAHLCDGAGQCLPGGAQTCAPATCADAACLSSCSDDVQCASSGYCHNGVCAAKQQDGAVCADTRECLSGFCVDGVCCDRACDGGLCEACSIAAGVPMDGACAPLTGTSCDDGERCTFQDTCEAGACRGTPVSCPAEHSCYAPGVCDPATGLCTEELVPDDTACDQGGRCRAGACQAPAPSGTPALMNFHSCAMRPGAPPPWPALPLLAVLLGTALGGAARRRTRAPADPGACARSR